MDERPAVDLYNFDHGFNKPGAYRFGPYRFDISQQDVDALSKLTRSGRTTFTHDDDHRPIVVRAGIEPGAIVKTATVSLVDRLPHAPNQLHAGSDEDGFGDLALLLSFLTGRQVFLPSMIIGTESTHCGEIVVGGNYFLCNGVSWPQIDQIAAQGLIPAIWAAVNSKKLRDSIGQMLYASSAFDAICTRWAKSGMTKRSAEERKQIKSATESIETILDGAFEGDRLTGYKKKIASIFDVSGVAKATAFLVSMGLVDPQSDEAKQRVVHINRVRNIVVHEANIPSYLHEDEYRRAEIATAIMVITQEIVCLRLADVAGIHDYQVEMTRKSLRSFFDSGDFRGHKIFDESYEQFAARIEQQWTGPQDDEAAE